MANSSSSSQPDIARIRNSSLRERVEAALTDLILKNAFAPGDLLPSEAELARSFGVSRAALREAMRALEARGLVETVQGKGILVKEPQPSYVSEALSLLLQRKTATLVDLWDARLVLETGIVERACKRATRQDLEALQESIIRFSQPNADVETLVQEDECFHTILVQASHNLVLALLMKTIGDLLRESRRTTLQIGSGPDVAGHTAICDAIAQKDTHAARQAMIDHLQHARHDLIAAGIAGWAEDGRDRGHT
jgi:GntR family transcriptional repressor for pyruvate dehydrogenase complex